MKRQKFYLVSGIFTVSVTAALVFFMVSGCGTKSERDKVYKETENFSVQQSELHIPLLEGQKEPAMEIHLRLPELKGSLDSAVNEILYAGKSAGKYKNTIVEQLKTGYFSTAKELGETGPGMNWYYTEDFDLLVFNDRLIVVKRMIDYYLGGAHGMTEGNWFVIDRETGRRLGIWDIVEKRKEAEFLPIVEKNLRLSRGIVSGENLAGAGFFQEHPDLTENFYIWSKGLGLYWNPYAIAPYVMGPINIVIPWNDIRGLLSESGKELVSEVAR